MVVLVLRTIVVLILAGVGIYLGQYLPVAEYMPSALKGFEIVDNIIGLFIGIVLGVILAPFTVRKIMSIAGWVEHKLTKLPTQDIMGGVLGLIIGLIIAVLTGSAFSFLPVVGSVIKAGGAILFGYLGLSIGLKRKEDLFGVAALFSKFGKEKGSKPEVKGSYSAKILDTSVIIDGRIADIVDTGFIEGSLVIPGFVLEELRHIADSSDLLKRNRGRRGLDILNKIRKELNIKVEIMDMDFEEIAEVDSKLVKLAQVLQGKIVTNDYNLNKVAELQGVPVLNINELANAVKPIVLPGEEMTVQIIKDGKESGQGVAYLDDGTMIVVDGGKRVIGDHVKVLVTSVLQTAAGRMIFAKLKSDRRQAEDLDSRLNEVNAIG